MIIITGIHHLLRVLTAQQWHLLLNSLLQLLQMLVTVSICLHGALHRSPAQYQAIHAQTSNIRPLRHTLRHRVVDVLKISNGMPISKDV